MAALPLRATPSKCFSKEAPAANAWEEQPFLLLLVIVAVVVSVAELRLLLLMSLYALSRNVQVALLLSLLISL